MNLWIKKYIGVKITRKNVQMVFSRTTRKKRRKSYASSGEDWTIEKKILSFLPLLWKVFSHFVWTNHDLSIWLHPPILSSEKIEIIPKSNRKKKYYFVCNIFTSVNALDKSKRSIERNGFNVIEKQAFANRRSWICLSLFTSR